MRLFVGVALPGDAKDALARFIDAARGERPEAKWVPRENLHLTMSFLGEVSDERVPDITGALGAAATRVRGPIPTALAGAGAFPTPRRARVLWAGLDDPEGRLGALTDTVAGALEPHGFSREKRAWTAHVTTARLREPRDVTAVLALTVEPIGFAVGEVTLFHSRLARSAPAYEILERWELGR